jgi:hypothetical protein
MSNPTNKPKKESASGDTRHRKTYPSNPIVQIEFDIQRYISHEMKLKIKPNSHFNKPNCTN